MGKRSDRLITSIRKIVENETANSYTDIEDSTILEYMNEGQRQLQELLLNNNINSFVKEYTASTVSDQEEYTLPTDIMNSSSIIKVEYTDNASESRPRYYPLHMGTEIDRQSDISGLPRKYILRDKYDTDGASLLLSPVPSNALAGIRVTYRQEVDNVDKRRGIISAITLTSTQLTALTLDVSGDPPIDSEALENEDFFCIVDKLGTIKMANIQLDSIDTATGVVTLTSSHTFESGETGAVGNYVVSGRNTSSHLKLPRRWEDYVKYWTAHAILEQDSNSDATMMANKLLVIQEEILRTAARMNEDYFEIPITDRW